MKIIYSKIIFCVLLIFICNQKTKASKINASTFGYNTTDVTIPFNTAINSNADTVIIDFVGTGDWVITSSTFTDITNKTIIFEPSVRLLAKPGAFVADIHLLKFIRGINIKISGYGASFQMQKVEYTTGEFRHTLQLENCKDILVEGLQLKDSGGDGIYIGGEISLSPNPYCENVIIKDCVMDNNRRQGMSVISAKNLLVSNCLFKNTKGTLPEAGVDLEPYEPYQRIENCRFTKCRFINNNGHGIELAFFYMTNASTDVNVTFEDCYTGQNHDVTNTYKAAEIYASVNGNSPVLGQVNFNNCLVENSQWSAFACRKPSNSVQVNFNNSIFKNISQAAVLYNNPLWIEIAEYNLPVQGFGGVNFNNVLIDYSSNMAVLATYGVPAPAAGLQNITGNIFVKNTNYNIPTDFNNINSFLNVTYTNTYMSALPAQTVEINTLNGNSFFEKICNKALINISRNTNNNSMPLAIKYTTGGTATDANDYWQMPLYKIIKANENIAVDTVLFRDDNVNEPIETMQYDVQNNTDYTITANPVISETIQDNSACVVLPLKKLLLTTLVQNANKTITINWQTNNEENNNYFEIEKSTDGINFVKIGLLNSAGNTFGNTNYSFVEVDFNKNIAFFYRIKQTDINGNYNFSNIEKLKISNINIIIYPNPAKNIIYVESNKQIKAYEIVDVNGKTCLKNNFTNNKINISTLPQGFFILKFLTEAGNVEIIKLIKE